jgi:hypothetical protein
MNIFQFGFVIFILLGGMVGAFVGYVRNGGFGALVGVFGGAVLGLAFASLITLLLAVWMKVIDGGTLFTPRRPKSGP